MSVKVFQSEPELVVAVVLLMIVGIVWSLLGLKKHLNKEDNRLSSRLGSMREGEDQPLNPKEIQRDKHKLPEYPYND